MKSELYGKSCFLKELSIILEVKAKKRNITNHNKIICILILIDLISESINFSHWPQVLYTYM